MLRRIGLSRLHMMDLGLRAGPANNIGHLLVSAMRNPRNSEAGGVGGGWNVRHLLRAFKDNEIEVKVIPMPEDRIFQKHKELSALLTNPVNERDLVDQKVLITISHSEVTERVIHLLKRWKDEKTITSIKVFDPKSDDIGTLFPDNLKACSVSKFVFSLRNGMILDLFTASQLVSYLQSNKTVLLVEPREVKEQ